MTDWIGLFAAYRAVVIREDEVVQGVLRPELDPDGAQVRAALAEWDGMHFLHHTADGVELTLVRPLRPRRRERWWLHLVLFFLTLLTTTLAGAYFQGRAPLRTADLPLGPWRLPVPVDLFLPELLPGIAFSVPLLLILLGHEMGHFLVARRHRMDVSLPFFVPAPPSLNLIGTFGAFIRLRSAVINRVVLLDVGAAGPVAGLLLSVLAILVGARWSIPLRVPAEMAPTPYAALFGSQPIWLGESLAFAALARLGGIGEGVWALHPLAFAGWLGLFVTALNLFPLAQLDGGHILYALVGPAQRWVGVAFLAALVVLGRSWWGWWFWVAVVLVLGRGSIRHPAVFDPTLPVVGARRALGWACVAAFVATFVPLPFHL